MNRSVIADSRLGALPEQSLAIDTGHIVFSLILVLFVIILCAGFIRWFGKFPVTGTSRIIRIAGAVNVGPRERIILIEVENTHLLIGVTSSQVQTLHVLDSPAFSPPENTLTGQPSQFKELLNSIFGFSKTS